MIEEMIFLQTAGFAGAGIGQLFQTFDEMGFFTYLLPFLLIFALVNGILDRTGVFKNNKSINTIISMVVGFMAIQSDTVSIFFAEIFPRVGVGLAVMLVILILVGIFIPHENWVTYTLVGISFVAALVVFFGTTEALSWAWASVFRENFGLFLSGLIIIIVFAIVANSGNDPEMEEYETESGEKKKRRARLKTALFEDLFNPK